MTNIPRIVIAGTHSGCGKTTVAGGIMAALAARGLKVQPFKVGPDFIDPSHHTQICGRVSRNLDPFMMGDDGCTETFIRASKDADIAVIEGVMGMFDGIDGTDRASTAHVARILHSPVILVADVKGMSRSVHAVTRGFAGYDPSVKIAGIIYNRIGSPRHKEMIAASGVIPALGWIPKREEIGLASRHLGLVMAHEADALMAAGSIIEEYADPDAIIAIAHDTLPMGNTGEPGNPVSNGQVTVGIAQDAAFCFYYADNLDKLRHAGAKLTFFSPLIDKIPDADLLYFGGGYPELHLPRLESSSCTRTLRSFVDDGLPVYAECGGLMYLTREVRGDTTHRMTGVLPADAMMADRIQALGYVKGESSGTSPLLQPGLGIAGHEFHYSRLFPDRDAGYAIRLSRGCGIDGQNDGLCSGSAVGTYTHAYFSREYADSLVREAARYKKS